MSTGTRKQGTYKMTPGIFQVESILQRGRSGNEVFYLIKWKGYSEQEATWEPESNLSGCREAILQFQNIIKKLEQQKSQSKTPPAQTKRKTKKENQRKFLTSQSKELSHEELAKQNQSKIPENMELSGRRVEQKKQQRAEPQKLETKPRINTSNLESSSSHQNEVLESTTAQTMAPISNGHTEIKRTLIDHLIDKGTQNSFQKSGNPTYDKKTMIQVAQKSMKLRNSSKLSNPKEEKKHELKRQRQQSSVVQKRIQKITKKNKKQLSLSNELRPKEFQQTQEKEKQVIKSKDTLIKNQQHKISIKPLTKNNDMKTLNPTNENVKIQKNQTNNFSRRSALCDQQFKQLITEMIGCFDPKLKLNSKFEQDQRNIQDIRKIVKKFIDLSSSDFQQANHKISKIILKKEQVQKLDSQGDFLYCDIEALIKLKRSEQDEISHQWISVLRNHESWDNGEKSISYFVRIDDMDSQTWKKKFRKFLIPKI